TSKYVSMTSWRAKTFAVKIATATISPTCAQTSSGSQNYSVTVTNDVTSSNKIHQITITMGTGFGNPTGSTSSNTTDWTIGVTTNKITITSNSPSKDLSPAANLVITFGSTAPS